jgi:hypothetical protein
VCPCTLKSFFHIILTVRFNFKSLVSRVPRGYSSTHSPGTKQASAELGFRLKQLPLCAHEHRLDHRCACSQSGACPAESGILEVLPDAGHPARSPRYHTEKETRSERRSKSILVQPEGVEAQVHTQVCCLLNMDVSHKPGPKARFPL